MISYRNPYKNYFVNLRKTEDLYNEYILSLLEVTDQWKSMDSSDFFNILLKSEILTSISWNFIVSGYHLEHFKQINSMAPIQSPWRLPRRSGPMPTLASQPFPYLISSAQVIAIVRVCLFALWSLLKKTLPSIRSSTLYIENPLFTWLQRGAFLYEIAKMNLSLRDCREQSFPRDCREDSFFRRLQRGPLLYEIA